MENIKEYSDDLSDMTVDKLVDLTKTKEAKKVVNEIKNIREKKEVNRFIELTDKISGDGNIIRAVFLLLITICANYLGNTLSCNLQYNLIFSAQFRHIFLFLMIMFTMDITSDRPRSIKDILSKSFTVYLFYLLLSKQSFLTTNILIILLIVIYLIHLQTNYLKSKDEEKLEELENLEKITSYVMSGAGAIAISGFMYYFLIKLWQFGFDFNILTFVFGTNTCRRTLK
jgi:hypothetical protein